MTKEQQEKEKRFYNLFRSTDPYRVNKEILKNLTEWPSRPSKYCDMIKEEAVLVLVLYSKNDNFDYEFHPIYNDEYRLSELINRGITKDEFKKNNEITKSLKRRVK
jgi:hypothetical protein